MRERQEPGKDSTSRHERPRRVAPAPESGTAAHLLHLQRTLGNAAVARMVEGAQGEDEVQRSAVHGVLSSSGQPLGAPVREEMESRMGADFSDVRVHTGGTAQRSAAEIGARAYTSGNHVVLGSGASDKHTLAHELTHVLQQRSGPVAGTDNGDGLKVSDPSDRYERAAEDNARRVMADSGSGRTDDAPAESASPPSADEPQIQRKVGYEFEITPNRAWQFFENIPRGDQKGGKRLKTDTKNPLIDLGSGAHVAADNGNVEFVTDPLTTLDQVESAVSNITNFHEDVARRGTHTEPSGKYSIKAESVGQAKPQASFGMAMRNIPDLVSELDKFHQGDTEPPAKRTRTREPKETKENRDNEQRISGVQPGFPEAKSNAERIVEELKGRARGESPQGDGWEKSAKGFLTVILKTIYDLTKQGSDKDDPKYYFSMMPRTDFVSMRETLPDDVKAWLVENCDSGVLPLMSKHSGEDIERPVLNKYKKEISGVEVPTRAEWIRSVLTGTVGEKDLLSPPPGYPAHGDGGKEPEGVGAMGADRTEPHLSVFELRDLGGALPREQWLSLALLIAKTIGRATDDKRLTVKEKQREEST